MLSVAGNRTVIGICLGSQFIGEALGAGFDHSPVKEIGKFPIFLTCDGLANEKFAHFGSWLDVGHWHNDMPGLRPDTKIIAYSEGCPRQIVVFSKRVYGFQCHIEFIREVIELLIANADPSLETLTHHRFVQQAEALRQNDNSDMNSKLFMFLAKLSEEYKTAHL